MLFISIHAFAVSAQERTNTGIKADSIANAARSEKISRFVNRNEFADVTTNLLSIDKRVSEINQRVSQLEQKKEESDSLITWVLKAIESVFSEIVGFAVFAVIVTFSLKNDLKSSIREGLVSIGETLAGVFVANVVPQIETFRNDAISILRSKTINYVTEADLTAPEYVDIKLESAQQMIAHKKYHDAEVFLKKLSDEYHAELKIVAKLYDLYNTPEFVAASDPTTLAKDCVHFLEKKEEAFPNAPGFYYFLCWAYTKFSGTGRHHQYYKLSVNAAQKAINLEPNNPRWHSLLGIAHDSFGVAVEAITATEKALKFAEDQSDSENIARAKNNLAYYYAEVGQISTKEKAIAYARDACKHDASNKLKYPFSLDTLGYVLSKFGESKEELEEAVEVLHSAALLEPSDRIIAGNLLNARNRLESFSRSDC